MRFTLSLRLSLKRIKPNIGIPPNNITAMYQLICSPTNSSTTVPPRHHESLELEKQIPTMAHCVFLKKTGKDGLIGEGKRTCPLCRSKLLLHEEEKDYHKNEQLRFEETKEDHRERE
ncbi:hypothetical protein FEM48_Zijuj06G0136100 [Ziziphus jujuba var. spinosa]|uniref:Uncharacterized protein n=1 Tax=Ziziphus jujuba var. spinosa TaxID=714518 RepID=A0A978V9L0_ZIZJJ|nr:hypothetical protein FEM48_Zijuj06G0136100 [Ziziphus jujuba var. spinosa]